MATLLFYSNREKQFSFLVYAIFLLRSPMAVSSHSHSAGSGPVIPTTPLVGFLERVQATALQTYGKSDFDPKNYVDLSLKSNLSVTLDAFDKLPRMANGSVSVDDLELFIGKYFNGAGDDLIYSEPVDFVPEPHGFLSKVENPQVRGWALEVHALWKNLSRKVSSSVHDHPDLHTLLPLSKPVIIPGSRFREVYYWDSYWVIRGLLASKMYETAKAIVTNLIFLLDTYGHVLNEIHELIIRDTEQSDHSLNRYYAMWNKPRPESSTIDEELASKFMNVSEKQQFYRELASTAESGWDFSTRWMRNSSDITTLATTTILPVDLNIFMLRMELDIAFLAKTIGENAVSEDFLRASQKRHKAFSSIFWNENMGQWLDYWLNNGADSEEPETWKADNQNQKVFASNFVPLWIDVFNSDIHLVEKVTKSLQTSGLLCAAGIATSLTNSGQQWDFPNGWAPLQHMIVEGLSRSASIEARRVAKDIAERWLRTNYVAYKKTGAMHEKYDVEKCGDYGGGGEYIPQTGFGWSNGVVLAFLEEFGWPKHTNIDCN
ncbi:hypothetical protein V6N13_107728 [Hibiscus sabdariffa]|uniref:Trehalase n=1 Tax=Hibiscus sabdariffa TaxID=183260 RepID=A0ABR2SR20_9ROSI